MLLRSDGTADACGFNHAVQLHLPVLAEGATYTGFFGWRPHTLLRSDGKIDACGYTHNRLNSSRRECRAVMPVP